jgi:hypothetical protein
MYLNASADRPHRAPESGRSNPFAVAGSAALRPGSNPA